MGNTLSRRDFIKITSASIAGVALSGNIFTKVLARPGGVAFSPIRFAVIADLHLDVNGENDMKMSAESVECLRRTVIDLNDEDDLAFVLVLGDLLLDGELENARVVKKYLDRLNMPSYVICGNHDFVPPDPKKHRAGFTYLTIDEFVAFFRGHGYDKSGKRYYSKQIVPGLRLIGLDACLPDNPKHWGGILPGEQLQWLDNQLSDHTDEFNLVFMHHNFIRWSEDEQPGHPMQNFCIDNDVEVQALLSKHANAASVVISGHRHIGLRSKEENSVNYFVVPSLNSHPMRYSVFTLTPQSISWKTPMVTVPETVHLEARNNLLKANFWRGEQFKTRDVANDQAVLNFYEKPDMIFGKNELIKK